MGRPPIGAAVKDKVAACRLTENERQAIVARFGTVATFFRLKLNEELYEGSAE